MTKLDARRGTLRHLVLGALLLSATHFAFGQPPSSSTKTGPRPRLLLIAQGPDGHPVTTHEYVAGVSLVEKMLRPVAGLDLEVVRADGAWEEGPEKLRSATGAFLFVSQGAKWIQDDPRRFEAFTQLASRGGGLSVLHWGMGTKEPQFIDGFVKLFGGCHGGPDRKYKILETKITVAPDHPIAAGIGPFMGQDEFYYRLKFAAGTEGLRPCVQAEMDGQAETVGWTWERPDGGRSFGFSGGHYHRNWASPEYRRLITQGILWTVRLPIPAEGYPVEVSAEDLQLPAVPASP